MKKLTEKWEDFFRAFNPWFVLMVLATILSVYFSIKFKDNQHFSNLLAALGSITGGIAGSIFQNEYNKNAGQEILEKKGLSAVRNLKSIQKQMVNLKDCIAIFLKKSTSENKSQLEEVYRHISTMELSVDSGYEDWIDILPQLSKEKEAQAKIYEKYQEASRSLVADLLDQKMKLYQAASDAEKEASGKKIAQLEKHIKLLKNEDNSMILSSSLNRASFTVGGGGGGTYRPIGVSTIANSGPHGLYNPGVTVSAPCLGANKCSRCGKGYHSTGLLSSEGSDLCPECDNIVTPSKK